MDDRRLEKIKQILQQRQPDLTLITDNVNNLLNLSAIIRSCEAVGMMELYFVTSHSLLPTHYSISYRGVLVADKLFLRC